MRLAICTIVTRSHLAQARSLLDSVAEFEPGADRFVLIFDDVAGVETCPDATVLRPDDVLDPAAFGELARRYTVLELACALKPFALRHLIDRDYDRVLYFDADIQLFAPIDELTAPLTANDIVLTPHVTDALSADGVWPYEMLLLRCGMFNLGFVGVANTAVARTMLRWWGERLIRYCKVDVAGGLFVDQRWVDLVPMLFERTAIVRHRGCNVAWWNLRARRLAKSDELRLESGEPLVFFHFSSFDPRRPERICRFWTPIDMRAEPRVQRLLAAYAQRLIERGYLERSRIPYALRAFSLAAACDALVSRLAFMRASFVYGRASRRATKRYYRP